MLRRESMATSSHHGAVAIVTNVGRTRFFVQRKDADYRPHPRGFSLFGGAIEPDESPAAALARELVEELGEGAATLRAAPAVPVFLARTLAAGFTVSLFEIVLDDGALEACAAVPVLEGECGEVVDRERLRALDWIAGVDELVAAYLEQHSPSARDRSAG